jgi:fatty-acyl-CoA synthase
MINLSSFVEYHAGRAPDATALTYQSESITYRELYRRIVHLAGWIAKKNVGPGDVVAVLMKNSAAFVEIAFAVSHIGAVFLPINFRLAPMEVSYILEDSVSKVLFVDEELCGSISTTRRDLDVVVVSASGNGNTLELSNRAAPASMVRRESGDLFRLMYTSGTTDRPKGVMHSYANFYWKCKAHDIALGLNSSVRLLVAGPLYHVGAFDLPGLAVLWHGGMLSLQRDFDAVQTLSLIESERITGAWLAPVMTSALLSSVERGQRDVSSLQWVIGGGERTPENRIRTFTSYFTNARYIDSYGLTESCSGDTFMTPGQEIMKIGSTGVAVPHLEIGIFNQAGTRVEPGTDGEICLRGPKIFLGYWRDPEKTNAAFSPDGWFRTGDIGRLDHDGFLYLTDRKKDMIISGGENIASSEVERVIQLLSCVAEVAVIGVPDRRWGETPAAIIVPCAGATLDLATLKAHCYQHLAGFKAPKYLILRNGLPRNPSGKILKRQLREEVSAALQIS